MYQLKNEYLTAEFAADGRLITLINNTACHGNVIACPPRSGCKIIFRKGNDWENVARSEDQTWEVHQQANVLTFTAEQLVTRRCTAAIRVTQKIALIGDQLHFGGTIESHEPDSCVTDFEYPRVGMIRTLSGGPLALYYADHDGVRISNVGAYLHSLSYDAERQSHSRCAVMRYPGGAGSMQWMALEDGGETLCYSGRDAEFYASEFRAEAADCGDLPVPDGAENAVTLTLDKMAFVYPEETWEAPELLVSLYTGDWHKGAREYAEWMQLHRPKHEHPRWTQEMIGYFLVIMKQQYGDEMWRYDQIEQLQEIANAHGFDTLGLFAWFHSGHDNQYPDLTVSESLGGEKVLREQIRKVQEKGGHVTLYQQAHLIDPTTRYYRNGGYRYEIRSRWNQPYFEDFFKNHQSNFLKRYSNKLFALACDSCTPWQDLMIEKTDWAASFGADGVLFDQIGGSRAYPCFNSEHPHAKGKPSLALPQGRRIMMDRIQKETARIGSGFAFLSEQICDVYSPYLDCLHGIGPYPSAQGNRAAFDAHPEEVRVVNYPELFRYCFPETVITVRNAHPYVEPRLANYAFEFGFRIEMELRYAQDQEEILADVRPDWREYSRQVSDLRRPYWDLIGNGDFVDQEGITIEGSDILAKAFVREQRLGVTLWNDSDHEAALCLTVPGYELKEIAAIGEHPDTLPKTLQPQQILLAVYEKKEGLGVC